MVRLLSSLSNCNEQVKQKPFDSYLYLILSNCWASRVFYTFIHTHLLGLLFVCKGFGLDLPLRTCLHSKSGNFVHCALFYAQSMFVFNAADFGTCINIQEQMKWPCSYYFWTKQHSLIYDVQALFMKWCHKMELTNSRDGTRLSLLGYRLLMSMVECRPDHCREFSRNVSSDVRDDVTAFFLTPVCRCVSGWQCASLSPISS